MTVKELILKLLDAPMDATIHLRTTDGCESKDVPSVFYIDKASYTDWTRSFNIDFTDWRFEDNAASSEKNVVISEDIVRMLFHRCYIDTPMCKFCMIEELCAKFRENNNEEGVK